MAVDVERRDAASGALVGEQPAPGGVARERWRPSREHHFAVVGRQDRAGAGNRVIGDAEHMAGSQVDAADDRALKLMTANDWRDDVQRGIFRALRLDRDDPQRAGALQAGEPARVGERLADRQKALGLRPDHRAVDAQDRHAQVEERAAAV